MITIIIVTIITVIIIVLTVTFLFRQLNTAHRSITVIEEKEPANMFVVKTNRYMLTETTALFILIVSNFRYIFTVLNLNLTVLNIPFTFVNSIFVYCEFLLYFYTIFM